MNISYNWLRDLCRTQTSPADLANRLTMVGLAVDAVHEAGEDFVLEFDVTSNRPDCLSHLGVAREAATLEGLSVSLPQASAIPSEGRAADFASVRIDEPQLCPRYTARIVRGVRVAPSPAWLTSRLQAIGQRPINNVADITNYVLHELGQPIHAFDLSTLEGREIIVRRARAGEHLKTLDGVGRELDEEMLVIADAARAVALAGVMGGEETEVSDRTRDVLIESAFFDPASVRRTAQALGLSTEASYRFERGVDREGALRAQERAAALICELAGGTATEDAIDVRPIRYARPVVPLRFARVKGLTGLDVPSSEAMRILRALGFTLVEDGGNGDGAIEVRSAGAGETKGGQSSASVSAEPRASASFVAPTWRFDIEREEDLVEEVARHAGYDKVEEILPASNVAGEYRPGNARRRAARRALNAQGFDEALNFSFISSAHDGLFDLLPALSKYESDANRNESDADRDDSSARFVTVMNPIIEGVTRMRPTLLPGLLDNVRHNLNHGTRNVRLFEIGRVFVASREAGQLPEERTSFALVAIGGAVEAGRAGAARELDFYDLKGALEAALEAMNVEGVEFEAATVRHLREGQSARISVGGESVGTLGRLAEDLAARYRFKQPVYVAEVDFTSLLAAPEAPVRYKPLPRYPSIMRDISLVVERRVTLAEMKLAIAALGVEECRSVELVDVFEGANVPEGKRSVTLRLEYRSDERTLRDEEVDALHARIVEALETTTGAKLRG
ncbi:MAG TPA: phenylalanine--tRNA ligase subunit beta [Pyrinomonadaceae bacterium]|jgi:phenylalanyl-tRNA synthetase beta chain